MGKAMRFEYEIRHRERITSVIANTRKEAIELHCKQTGMPKDYFSKHCSIKNVCVVTKENTKK